MNKCYNITNTSTKSRTAQTCRYVHTYIYMCVCVYVYESLQACVCVYVCVPVVNGPTGHQVVQEEHPFPALKWRSSDF